MAMQRKGHLMDRGTLMVLKRFLILALGAFGIGALVTGPAFAQGIPIPGVLGDQAQACATPAVTDTAPTDLPGSIMPIALTDASCTDVAKDIAKFRTAYDDVVSYQEDLDMAIDTGMGNPTAVQQENINFLTTKLQESQAEKSKYIGDSVADAVYAEKDAIGNFGEAYEAVNEPLSGTDAAQTAAQTRYNDVSFTYDYDGDDTTAETAKTISTIATELATAQGVWDTTAYAVDGSLLETIPPATLTAAKDIAILKNALDAANAVASAELSALSRAKDANTQAKDTLLSAANAVTGTMKGVVSRVEGAGDSVETRLAQRARSTLTASNDANEDRMEGEEILAEDEEELRDAEGELADAESDYNTARTTYDDVLADDGSTADEIQTAEIALADAANQVASAETAVADAKADVRSSSDALNAPRTGLAALAASAKQAYDDALAAQSGTYNFEDGNPVAALADELVKDPAVADQGGALIEALDATWDNTQANRAAISGLTGETGQVAINTAGIATNKTDIGLNRADIDTNTANIATNRVDIDTNTANIATNAGGIMMNAGNIATNTAGIGTNTAGVAANSGRIDAAESMIGENRGMIGQNSTMIGELSESLEVVRAGVAASMALAGMPAINGRGISIGVGSFDGESAFAIGFQIQSESTSFKIGLTSGGGATGASAGVGFQF